MRFNTLLYLGFLGVVAVVLHALPLRARKAWLLVTSYAFYAAWSLAHLGLLFGVGVFNHLGARWVAGAARRRPRAAWIVGGNLLVLVAYKYLGWLGASATSLGSLLGADLGLSIPRWALPLGISFYVFQAIGYVVDVARRREEPQSFVDVQLFLAFFPKLAAGPLLRMREFAPEVQGRIEASARDVAAGVRQIVIGLFLKVVLADSLASSTTEAFARNPGGIGARDVWVMAMAFTLQLYLDFSGYSRIALGSAQLCGIRLVDNFNHPLISVSLPEFWTKWHMSLSRWVRDYVFVPLKGRSTSLGRHALATIGSMLVFGLWHGAGGSYAVWGLYHGTLLSLHHVLVHGRRSVRPFPGRSRGLDWATKPLGFALTLGSVCLGGLLFHSATLDEGLAWIAVALSGRASRPLDIYTLETVFLAGAVVLAGVLAPSGRRLATALSFRGGPGYPYAAAACEGLGLGVLLVMCATYWTRQSSFIYFQF